MKIYTYYEDYDFESKQKELIDLWKISWERQGFKTTVLDRTAAISHPYYEEFLDNLKNIFNSAKKTLYRYELSCFLRWLSYAAQEDEKFYVSDYDIINTGLKLPEPDEELHLMDDACPCIASGRPKQFEKLCKLFIDILHKNISKINEIASGRESHLYHDQDVLVNGYKYFKDNLKFTRRSEIACEMDVFCDSCNKDKIIHVSNNFIFKTQKKYTEYKDFNRKDLRLILAKRLLNI